MHTFKQHRFDRGLVIGKFYPPHRGHKFLIETALARCREVTVIVCSRRDESIPGSLRAAWTKKIHPQVSVKLVEDPPLSDDDSKGWATYTLQLLGFVPDAVFTSEAYGDPYAAFMGSVHVLVDKERVTVPISATIVRSNPLRYAMFLEPVVRASFAWRVCVIGAESTGTTTLAKALAEKYKTVWVPEFGRMYAEGKQRAEGQPEWRTEEFVHIAEAQEKLEDALAESSNGLVICDTDAFATGIWHERYLGYRSPLVDEIGRRGTHHLYLVTGDEIPFVQDGTRDGEHIRHAMHQRFLQRLQEEGKNFIVVQGKHEDRLRTAIHAIDRLAAGTPR